MDKTTVTVVPWQAGYMPGDGFFRAEDTLAPHAVKLSYDEKETSSTVNASIHEEVIDRATNYAKTFEIGSSASFSGWGGANSAVSKYLQEMKVNSRTISCLKVVQFSTEPILLYKNDNEPELVDQAKEYMKQNGPTEFHKKFGTHFIAGYSIGGSFIGQLKLVFQTSDDARTASAIVKAEYTNANLNASSNFELSLKKQKVESTNTVWVKTTGWSNEKLPKIQTYKELLDASAEFDLSKGVRTDAVLRRFEDLTSYHVATQSYYNDKPNEERSITTYIEESEYRLILKHLNKQYFSFQYLNKLLDDEKTSSSSALSALLDDTKNKVMNYLALFGFLFNKAEDLQPLINYFTYVEGSEGLNAIENQTKEGVKEKWEKGKIQHGLIFRADQMERIVTDAIKLLTIPVKREKVEDVHLSSFPEGWKCNILIISGGIVDNNVKEKMNIAQFFINGRRLRHLACSGLNCIVLDPQNLFDKDQEPKMVSSGTFKLTRYADVQNFEQWMNKWNTDKKQFLVLFAVLNSANSAWFPLFERKNDTCTFEKLGFSNLEMLKNPLTSWVGGIVTGGSMKQEKIIEMRPHSSGGRVVMQMKLGGEVKIPASNLGEYGNDNLHTNLQLLPE